jgi:hypothetical protein
VSTDPSQGLFRGDRKPPRLFGNSLLAEFLKLTDSIACSFSSVYLSLFVKETFHFRKNPKEHSRKQSAPGNKDSLFTSVQTSPGYHPTSFSMDTGVLCRGQSGRGMMLTAHLDLELRLRMNGAIPLFPLYAFMVWTGTNLAF